MGTMFLIAAIVGGTVLVCQFVLTIMGLGHDGGDVGHDMGGDFHGDAHLGGDFHGNAHAGGDLHADGALGDSVYGDHHTSFSTAADAAHQHPDSGWLFSVVSFRTLVAAAAFFGVTGRSLLSAGYANSTALILATVVGICAMYGMYWLLRLISGLSSSGNERIGNAVGRRATVYLRIPASRSGAGKVHLSMQNRIVEYQAVTDDNEPLKTGESVEVVGVAGGDIVQVRRSGQTAPA